VAAGQNSLLIDRIPVLQGRCVPSYETQNCTSSYCKESTLDVLGS
jgi:hypothetical protein